MPTAENNKFLRLFIKNSVKTTQRHLCFSSQFNVTICITYKRLDCDLDMSYDLLHCIHLHLLLIREISMQYEGGYKIEFHTFYLTNNQGICGSLL